MQKALHVLDELCATWRSFAPPVTELIGVKRRSTNLIAYEGERQQAARQANRHALLLFVAGGQRCCWQRPTPASQHQPKKIARLASRGLNSVSTCSGGRAGTGLTAIAATMAAGGALS